MSIDCFYEFEKFMFIKIVNGKCDFKSIDFQLVVSLYIYITIYVSLIRYNIVTFISLSLFRYRHRLVMRIEHFLFFINNYKDLN